MKDISAVMAFAVLAIGTMIFSMSVSASTNEIDAEPMVIVTIAPTA